VDVWFGWFGVVAGSFIGVLVDKREGRKWTLK
jgi:hypothetical protein